MRVEPLESRLALSATLPFDENFDDGLAQDFDPQAGDWTVEQGQYEVTPLLGEDGVSTVQFSNPLPGDLNILATFNADDVTTGRLSNAFVIFDYQGPTDFKFAGAFVGVDKWVIGHRTEDFWLSDVTADETIDASANYTLHVHVDGDLVTLMVDGATKLTHTYTGDSLEDGDVGVGTDNALARFDNFHVFDEQAAPPTATTLPISEDFESNAEFFAPQSGVWTVNAGRYNVLPFSGQDGISIVQAEDSLPSNLEILVTVNADDVSSGRLSNGFVIFDYQSPTDFKFAGAYVGIDAWVIGRRDADFWWSDVMHEEAIEPLVDYTLSVRLEGDAVTLLVDGVEKLSHTYAGDSLVDGGVGLGTQNAVARFDDFELHEFSTLTHPGLIVAAERHTDHPGGGAPNGVPWQVDGFFAGLPAADVTPSNQQAKSSGKGKSASTVDQVMTGVDLDELFSDPPIARGRGR